MIIAAFDGANRAAEVRDELKVYKDRDIIHVSNAAVIVKDQEGELSVAERAQDEGAKRSTGIGAIAGGVIGAILGGPIGGIVLGAGAGALAGKTVDFGFDDQELQELGATLGPGSSAIVAVVEAKWVPDLVEYLEDAGAQVKHQKLEDEAAETIAAAIKSDAGSDASKDASRSGSSGFGS